MVFFTIRCQRGFTLVELVVVVAIVGILAAIAIPAYQGSILKGRRGDAKEELMRLAQAEEKWRVSNIDYGTLVEIGGASASNYYNFAASNIAATTFTITATPTSSGGQNQDTCGTLTITQGATITSSEAACPTP